MADDQDQDEKPDSNDLAQERTGLAEDRNIMAMERTFAGWIRTAFAAIGIGLAFKAVFGTFDPPWLARAIATMFIAAGGALAYLAQRRACDTMGRLRAHQMHRASSFNFRVLGFAVIVGSCALIAGLWILNDDLIAAAG
ncbi:YidH family protein [Qipengyuania atrilutea]|uniref:DUF202 domain-containing protein n=1 Tax=Qipengyuania atrilutea TaxID=2744473 RepID=A0A850H465_9SPHN|nr:DUF202 domain-containing protein [Actirhodobacter atriluteus]NVD44688.1 DUF202 domain-containing protein [Actirhodobacter atriluteus]